MKYILFIGLYFLAQIINKYDSYKYNITTLIKDKKF
jgi:hypothetical protein